MQVHPKPLYPDFHVRSLDFGDDRTPQMALISSHECVLLEWIRAMCDLLVEDLEVDSVLDLDVSERILHDPLPALPQHRDNLLADPPPRRDNGQASKNAQLQGGVLCCHDTYLL